MKKLVNPNVCESAKLHHGVTVIEVLTSMLVALIGVFGVLILIPFSVQQAQIGLDQDAAAVVADNAFEDLQIYGLIQVADAGPLNLRGASVGLDTNSPPQTIPPFSTVPNSVPIAEGNVTVPFGCYSVPPSVFTPSLIHLDPIAFLNVGVPSVAGDPLADTDSNSATGNGGNNPDFLTGSLPSTTGSYVTRDPNPNGPPLTSFHEDFDPVDRTLNPLRMFVAAPVSNTSFSPAAGITVNELMSLPEVNRIFRTEDDIVTGRTSFSGGEVSDVELAQPVFDVSSQGNLVKRQSNGRISWSAVLQPIKDPTRVGTVAATPATKYKVFILVYGDRSVIPSDEDSEMMAAPVLRRATFENPNDTVLYPPVRSPPPHGGYDPAVNQIILGPDITFPGVFRDDWVMLINRRPLAPAGGSPIIGPVPIFDVETGAVEPNEQLVADEPGYAVQISFAKVISIDNEDDTIPDDSTVLHVDGGAFDFYYSDIHGATYDLAAADPMYTSATYVVHLKNVLNVYERTYTFPPE